MTGKVELEGEKLHKYLGQDNKWNHNAECKGLQCSVLEVRGNEDDNNDDGNHDDNDDDKKVALQTVTNEKEAPV